MKGFSKFILKKENVVSYLMKKEEGRLKDFMLSQSDFFKNITLSHVSDFDKKKVTYHEFRDSSRACFLIDILGEEGILEKLELIESSLEHDSDKQFKKRWGLKSFKIHLRTNKKIKRMEKALGKL